MNKWIIPWWRKSGCCLYILILFACRNQGLGRYVHKVTPLSVRRLKGHVEPTVFLCLFQCSYAPFCFDADLTWEHAEGMNETEQRTRVRCFLAHLAISSSCNGLSAAYSTGASQHILPGSQSAIRSWRASEGAELPLLFILPLTQMWLNYMQGIGLLCTAYGWSILSCAEARGFRSHHSYVFDTGFLPTVEDSDRCSVQCTPHRSHIPEDRLLHKHHHKIWLYPRWLHWVIIQISGCPREGKCFSYSRVTSPSLKYLRPTGY